MFPVSADRCDVPRQSTFGERHLAKALHRLRLTGCPHSCSVAEVHPPKQGDHAVSVDRTLGKNVPVLFDRPVQINAGIVMSDLDVDRDGYVG